MVIKQLISNLPRVRNNMVVLMYACGTGASFRGFRRSSDASVTHVQGSCRTLRWGFVSLVSNVAPEPCGLSHTSVCSLDESRSGCFVVISPSTTFSFGEPRPGRTVPMSSSCGPEAVPASLGKSAGSRLLYWVKDMVFREAALHVKGPS